MFLLLQSFSTLSRYQAHSRFHDNRRPYQCKICDKGFLHTAHHRLHRCCVTNRKYRCRVCQQAFKEILSLSHHFRKNHSRLILKGSSHFKGRALQKGKDHTFGSKRCDNKILLKITAGTSMTIISPSKNSSHEKKKRRKDKKYKKKPKESCVKNGIILSIKKGTINMSKEAKSKASKYEALSRVNGLEKSVIESFDKGSNLKMKIKTFSDRKAENEAKSQHQSSPNNSKRSKKMPVKLSKDTDGKSSPLPNDHQESRIRNGIVIVKDKSGKLLAEQLQSAKAKKRDNVFDSFGDVGLWKVSPSPRHDSPLDGIKLRFSPQKPLRIDTGSDLPFDKAKYLDVAISMKSQKTENYSEDSDVFETSPVTDKDSETGIQNVNDSGIEILSSSSCNRSNGNSVRSVILDENSPTYFPIEDSLMSLDSPLTELHAKSEHTVCPKCGGIIIEANNNAQSPRKCGCSSSVINSPTQVNSCMKLTATKLSQDSSPAPPASVYKNFVETEKKTCDIHSVTRPEKHENFNNIEGSDILSKCDKTKTSETLSEFDDVEIIRDSNDTSSRPKNDLKLRLKLKTRKTMVAHNKATVTVDNVRNDSENEEMKCEQPTVISEIQHENIKDDLEVSKNGLSGDAPVSNSEISPLMNKDFDTASEKQHKSSVDFNVSEQTTSANTVDLNVSEQTTSANTVDLNVFEQKTSANTVDLTVSKQKTSANTVDLNVSEQKTSANTVDLNVSKQKTSASTIDLNVSEQKTSADTDDLNVSEQKTNANTEITNSRINKKPLFKVKQKSIVNESVEDNLTKIASEDTNVNKVEVNGNTEKTDCVRRKKPIFKRRSLSGDAMSESMNDKNSSIKSDRKSSALASDSVKQTDDIGDEKEPHQETILELNTLPSKTEMQSLESHVKLDGDQNPVSCIPDPLVPCNGQKIDPFGHVVDEDDSLLQLPLLEYIAQSTSATQDSVQNTSPTQHQAQITSPTQHKAPITSPTQHKAHISSPTECKAQSTNPTVKKSTCTSPLDLFQQQFLSFLSSNKPHSREDKAKECQSDDKDVIMNSELDKHTTPEIKSLDSSITKESIDSDIPKECCATKKSSLAMCRSVSDRKDKKPKERLSLRKNKTLKINKDNKSEDKLVHNDKMPAAEKDCKQPEKHNQVNDQINHNDSLKNVGDVESKSISLTHEDGTEETGDTLRSDWLNTATVTSTSPPILEPRTDSLSWLKIFSENQDFKSATNKDDKSSNEESPDFSADLADINKKMDVSDDELNALDVDDVFKSTNLSSLQPISVAASSIKKRKAQSRYPESVKRPVSPLKRPRLNVDSGSELSDCSSNSGTIDLDTNTDFGSKLYRDSDEDFHMESFKQSKKNRKMPKQKCLVNDDGNSDSDNEFTRLKSQAGQELGVPYRRKRLKQGRKSCCSCCLGSQSKNSKEYHHHHKYKLPKNSKQFVKSSLKLLELQAKIHQLFLSLFPECAEIFSNSKIGTEEFELLIDEVLDSLEGKEVSFEAAAISPSEGGNEALHFHTPCTVHSLCRPELLQAYPVYHTQTDVSSMDHWPGNHRCHSESPETHREHVYRNHSAGIKQCFESEKGSELRNQTCDNESSKSFIESSIENQETFPQVSAQQFHPILPPNKQWQDFQSVSCDDASEFSAFDGLESDITITIDLNAAKVSLCRDPKHCLERLNNRISRLVQCFLPKLKLRKAFFRNFNNLHFLLDLMITANLPGSNNDVLSSEDECDSKHNVSSSALRDKHLSSTEIDLHGLDSYAILNSQSTVLSGESALKPLSADRNINHVTHTIPGERTPLLSKFQDIFEQEIKSHRESLKKDVFDLDSCSEKRDQSSIFKAKEVLTTISKIEKMNKARQRLRPRRDPRLRKRSEAESRKLFVQEKIQNNQNSTIVCHSSPKKSTTTPHKLRRRRRGSQSSKESFLSKLDLGGNSHRTTKSDDIVARPSEAAIDTVDRENTENTDFTDPVETLTRITEDIEYVDEGPAEDIKHGDNSKNKSTVKSESVSEDVENIDENERNLTDRTKNVTEDMESIDESARHSKEGTKNVIGDKENVGKRTKKLTEESKNVPQNIKHLDAIERNSIDASKNVAEDSDCGTEINSDLKTTSDQDICETGTEKVEESSSIEEDVDTRQKSGEKNIFELLQPS